MDANYTIDFEIFSTLEVIKIIEFFKLIEQTKTRNISGEILVQRYREYQNILKSKILEKKYDKMLYEKSKVSIYQTLKLYLNK